MNLKGYLDLCKLHWQPNMMTETWKLKEIQM